MTQDVCAVGISAGIQTFGIGISGGKHVTDENCERLKLARILNDFGMKVASVSLLCQDHRVFIAMNEAGTPCPFEYIKPKLDCACANPCSAERRYHLTASL